LLSRKIQIQRAELFYVEFKPLKNPPDSLNYRGEKHAITY